MTAAAGVRRAFFALWPGAAERVRLAGLARDCAARGGGRAVVADNVHATLVFLGALPPARVEDARAVGASVPARRFDLTLDRLVFRRRQEMVWAACRETPGELADLVEGLRAGCRQCGFEIEARAFLPHVTLVRHARRTPGVEMAPWKWPVDGYCLARSLTDEAGVHYEVVERWQA